MLKAINIKWDTDGDTEVLDNLPKEMIIPNYLEEYYCFDKNNKYATEEISDWLSNETGFCHNGFEIVKENTVESVEQELYDGVQKICKENGTTIEEITRDFLYFCADPKNTPFLQCWFKNNEE